MNQIKIVAICAALILQTTVAQSITDMMHSVNCRDDIASLFPKTVDELNQQVDRVKKEALVAIQDIIAIPDGERTFENTVAAYDYVTWGSDLTIMHFVSGALSMVSPDDAVRQASDKAAQAIEAFKLTHINDNVQLYQALKSVDENKKEGDLSPEQHYYLQETLNNFERLSGLGLPEEERARIVQLQKELVELTQQFSNAIWDDKTTVCVTREQLVGLSDDFIARLKRDEQGLYILGMDYPTYFGMMENCQDARVREQLYKAFNNRSYPHNEQTLKAVIAKRDALAQALGFASYADLSLANVMVKSPERAQEFLDELIARATIKTEQEFAQLLSDLPESVSLNAEGKMQPWDYGFVKNQYKKRHFSVDEQEITNYFPMEQTIEGLLDIYRQFLGLEFVIAPVSGLWHEEVQLVEMYESSDRKKLLGYLLLDLFPRPNKYSHACMANIIPAVASKVGQDSPAIALVIVNFSRPTAEAPSLLDRDFVRTFFHEFGHAIHALLGRTELAGFSGISVKWDFVETPSQMLEEWLEDAEILRKISCHYKTGEPLPYEMIAKMQQLSTFGTGFYQLRQCFLAQYSLDYFKAGADKDVNGIYRAVREKMLPMFAYCEQDHHYASFWHLMAYGAQYYGYLWSRVYALDLFEEIKKHGLLNSEIGKKYIREILQPGGSKDPNELIYNFLGRESGKQAFFSAFGL